MIRIRKELKKWRTIEAWMVSPGLDPAIVRVPGRAALPRSPERESSVIQHEGRGVFCCHTDLLVSRERDHGVMFSPNPCGDRRVRKRTSVICDHRRFLRFVWFSDSGGSIETLSALIR